MTAFSLPSLPPAPATTVADQVFNALYKAVVSADLRPGAKISEADVARQFDVSRQPVRDAFFRLSKLGFLLIRPQRATLITKISEEAVFRASFIRIALEVECIRTAAGVAGPAERDALEALIADQENAVAARDAARFHELDDAFHEKICSIAGQGYVWALIQEQKAHMDRVRFLSLASNKQSAFDEHRDMVAAIAAGDADKAEAILRQHLGHIGDLVSQIRAEHSQFFEDATE